MPLAQHITLRQLEAVRPIHFTFFVKWAGKMKLKPTRKHNT